MKTYTAPSFYLPLHLHYHINHVDAVQPCDTTQARSDLDFGVNVSIVQFYAIEHNFNSNHGMELKLYYKIPVVFVYVGGTFSSESTFRTDLRYRLEQAIRIMLFTSF